MNKFGFLVFFAMFVFAMQAQPVDPSVHYYPPYYNGPYISSDLPARYLPKLSCEDCFEANFKLFGVRKCFEFCTHYD
ncbi:hypothetical protein L596_026237 [Steinernema carpocapsae]|uniref:Uncharacterized protein n=1 Tax=Steinernema carpocapsae TaxID=34508 RepID=A0A4U5M0R6_STECR|nr:hypothetical protein L596_026237 [Steinernema carpocapsae]